MAIRKMCKRCKGTDIRVDAWAAWDELQQVWDLDDTFEEEFGPYCRTCETACVVIEEEIDPNETT